ncbi:MAG: EamA family transporter [Patescibacteria group bacterium]
MKNLLQYQDMSWMFYAFLSAIFAAATAILAKIGIKDINSDLATAIRTIVILFFAWGIVLYKGLGKQIYSISRFSLIFLILSGVATGLSWLFYFKALQMGEASKVAPIDKLSLVFTIILAAIILKEKINFAIVVGAVLMSAGAIIISFAK